LRASTAGGAVALRDDKRKQQHHHQDKQYNRMQFIHLESSNTMTLSESNESKMNGNDARTAFRSLQNKKKLT
jgi:hypothetical protein